MIKQESSLISLQQTHNKSTDFKLCKYKMQFEIVNCLQANNDLNVILYDYDENFNKKNTGGAHTHAAHSKCQQVFAISFIKTFDKIKTSDLSEWRTLCVLSLYKYVNCSTSIFIYVFVCVLFP